MDIFLVPLEWMEHCWFWGCVFTKWNDTIFCRGGGQLSAPRPTRLRFFNGHMNCCDQTERMLDLYGEEVSPVETTSIHSDYVASLWKSRGGGRLAGVGTVDDDGESLFLYFIPIFCFSPCSFLSQVGHIFKASYLYKPYKVSTSLWDSLQYTVGS